MAISRKNRLLDRLHRYGVNGMMVFSGLCAIFLGYRIYRFTTYTRPMLREQRKEIENELLSEGKPTEEEFASA